MYHPYLMLSMAEVTGEKSAEKLPPPRPRNHWSGAALRRVGTALRLAEAVIVLALLSWSYSRLPAALHLSGIFLRRVSDLLLSTPFIFLLGNAIVLTLLARSRHLTSTPSPSLYDELLRHSAEIAPRHDDREEVVYEDKAVCFVETRVKDYRRTRSEVAEAESEKPRRLRRSLTEVTAEATEEEAEEKETMSDEELRIRVEAFIAKQLKFHRAECVGMVSSGDLTAD